VPTVVLLVLGSDAGGGLLAEPNVAHVTAGFSTIAVDEANKCPGNGPYKDGHYEREAKADKPVGRTSKDSGAQITSCYMVVQDRWGGVRTMYPIACKD
jgi:hypothetical protein